VPPAAEKKKISVLVAEELRAAKIMVNGSPVEWARIIEVEVPANAAEGTGTIHVEWPGKECASPMERRCPDWQVDALTGSLEITAADFKQAPIRIALQGPIIEGGALFRKMQEPGSSTATYEGLAIQTEGQSSNVSLLPGSYTLVVRREGFPDFELPSFQVPDDPALARPIPVPLLVAIEVRSTPQNATVLLTRGTEEPQEIGQTGEEPIRRLLDRALSYRIKLMKRGYRSFEDALVFPPGATTLALAPTLDREEGGGGDHRPPPPPPGGTGKLTVITQPWTMVYVNGRRVRQTPLVNHDLPAGRYQLTLLNQDVGIRHTEMVVIMAGRTTTIRRTQDQLR
jgi:hypothetical protein